MSAVLKVGSESGKVEFVVRLTPKMFAQFESKQSVVLFVEPEVVRCEVLQVVIR